MFLHLAQDAESDQAAIGRRVGDVAGAEERRGGKAATHCDEIFRSLRQDIAPGHALAVGIGRGEQAVLPFRIEVAVVPGDVFLDHRARSGMRGDVIHAPFADHPDLAAVTQRRRDSQRRSVVGALRFPSLGTGDRRLQVEGGRCERTPPSLKGRGCPSPIPSPPPATFTVTFTLSTPAPVDRPSESPARRDPRSPACPIPCTPSGSSACMIAIITDGIAPTVPASPGPLRPQRIACGRHRIADDANVAQIVRARHAVIHETRRQQLPAFPVHKPPAPSGSARRPARCRHESAQPESAD